MLHHTVAIAAVASLLFVGGASSSGRRISQSTQSPRPIRIYVFATETGDDGYTLADVKDKRDSLRDLRPYLMGKKQGVVLVQSALMNRESADVIVEVLGRDTSEEDSDLRTVHLKVTAGAHTFTVDGKDDDGGWQDAAKNGAEQITRWIAANYAKLISDKAFS